MSADNGIMIIVSSDGEYRVGEYQNGEELTLVPPGHRVLGEKPFWNLPWLWRRFRFAKVFGDKEAARDYAHKLHDELPVCEYGVSEVHLERQFPTKKDVLRFQLQTLQTWTNTFDGTAISDIKKNFRGFVWELYELLDVMINEDTVP